MVEVQVRTDLSPGRFPGFPGPEPPKEEDIYRCVHCGLCLNFCPTYLVLRLETESPRGRIALMRAVHEGRIPLVPEVIRHWDLCLGCRACEAVCPGAVPYGRMIERTRWQVLQVRREGALARFLRWLVFRQLLPHPFLLRLAARLLWLGQVTGLQAAVRSAGLLRLLPRGLREAEAQAPRLPARFFPQGGRVYPARGRRRYRVALLSGCVMPLFQPEVMEAAVRVLTRNGCEVVLPRGQGCCGALNLHSGERDTGRAMARRLIDAFLAEEPDFILTASAGCGSTMKEYPELFEDDPVYRERAEAFASRVRDITEFLAELPLDPPRAALPLRVTYQDPCHLGHAQRITQAPRRVLGAIPGLELVEMKRPDVCCGAAGTYQLLQREMSRRILRSKMEDVAGTGAEAIVTANPGCHLQLDLGAREFGPRLPVYHVVQVLDRAYRAEEGRA